MRLNLMTSLIAATAIFTSVSPALAQSKSWINHDLLAENHRAYCDDIVAQDTHVNKGSLSMNNNGSTSSYDKYSTQQAHNNYSKGSANAGFNYLKIGGSLGGSQEKKNSSSSSKNTVSKQKDTWNKDWHTEYDKTTITSKTVGQNCGIFVQTAGQIEINNEQQKTQRMKIKTQKQLGVFQQMMNIGE
jgi:hypothetical protein